MGRSDCNKLVLTGLLVLATLVGGQVYARQPPMPDGLSIVSVAQLPPLGAHTYALIASGGPFPHVKDGVVFGNRERLLPVRGRGYYREYTVGTPGVSHRGTRRIVCGGAPRTPEVCYYTADHYASFRKIVP
ncbi:MAG: ribonuclease [Burkholderiaceae bacterium]